MYKPQGYKSEIPFSPWPRVFFQMVCNFISIFQKFCEIFCDSVNVGKFWKKLESEKFGWLFWNLGNLMRYGEFFGNVTLGNFINSGDFFEIFCNSGGNVCNEKFGNSVDFISNSGHFFQFCKIFCNLKNCMQIY